MNQKGAINIIILIISLAIVGGLSYLAAVKKPYVKPLDPMLPSSFRLISPANGEEWIAGSTHTVKWTNEELNPKATLWIYIPLADGRFGTVAPVGTPNTGSYTWTIPENFPSGKYKIHFKFSGSLPIEEGEIGPGNEFSIVKENQTTDVFEGVLRPQNPPTIFGTHRLTTSEGTYLVKAANETVLADLRRYENEQRVIVKGAITNKIIVERVFSGSVLTAESVKPISQASSIKVLSPNGGEKWVVGETYEIKWNSSSNISDFPIRIVLKESNPAATHWFPVDSFSSSLRNTGSYSWKIPETVRRTEGEILHLGGNTYLISVSAEPIGSGQQPVYKDESDAAFSIVSSQ